MLLTAMDETAQWAATKELRAWERNHLSLRSAQRLLDVGCGLGFDVGDPDIARRVRET